MQPDLKALPGIDASSNRPARWRATPRRKFLRWPPALQTQYHIVDQLFASRVVPCGPRAHALPRRRISPIYDAGAAPAN
jgi:hypothetical protein